MPTNTTGDRRPGGTDEAEDDTLSPVSFAFLGFVRARFSRGLGGVLQAELERTGIHASVISLPLRSKTSSLGSVPTLISRLNTEVLVIGWPAYRTMMSPSCTPRRTLAKRKNLHNRHAFGLSDPLAGMFTALDLRTSATVSGLSWQSKYWASRNAPVLVVFRQDAMIT